MHAATVALLFKYAAHTPAPQQPEQLVTYKTVG